MAGAAAPVALAVERMTDLELIEPGDRHDCRRLLPDSPGGYGGTGVRDGTVARCPERVCGRWWVSLPCYESYGPTSRWHRVRWWHVSARRRIRAHIAETGYETW